MVKVCLCSFCLFVIRESRGGCAFCQPLTVGKASVRTVVSNSCSFYSEALKRFQTNILGGFARFLLGKFSHYVSPVAFVAPAGFKDAFVCRCV